MTCSLIERLGFSWRLVYGIFFITCGLSVTILNVISLVILCRHSMRSQKSNYFLTSLVVSDVIMGVGMCPLLGISCLLSPVDYCIILKVLIMGFCLLYGSSVSSLAAIAYDRYLLIDPPTYHSRMTRRKTRTIIAVCWGIPLMVLWFVVVNRQTYLLICSGFVVLVTVVMVVCYRLIIKRISRQVELSDSLDQPRTNNQENVENTGNNNISALAKHKRRVKIVKNRKLAHRLFILIAVFCGCMLPTFIGAVDAVVRQLCLFGQLPPDFDFFERDSRFIKHFRIWSEIGGALNSFANPLIYTFTYPKFKAELRKIFPWFARKNNKVGVNLNL